jgi:hypothetical protein
MQNKGSDVHFEGDTVGKIEEIASVTQDLKDRGTREWRIEKIKKANGNGYLLRICYYKSGKWTNRPPTLNPYVFRELLKVAKQKEII